MVGQSDEPGVLRREQLAQRRVVGGATQYTYGVNNRFYAKVHQETGRPSMPRDIVDVSVTQTYYTDQRAAQFDQQYSTSFTTATPNNFSPIALNVRAAPSLSFNTTMQAEFDSKYLFNTVLQALPPSH